MRIADTDPDELDDNLDDDGRPLRGPVRVDASCQ